MIINKVGSIIIIVFVISIIYICFSYLKSGLTKDSVIDVPTNIKCFFSEDNCEQNNITAFTLCVSVIYFIIGYAYPDQYLVAIFSSIGFQVFKQWFRTSDSGSFIVDP